jgi:hypothetical protein
MPESRFEPYPIKFNLMEDAPLCYFWSSESTRRTKNAQIPTTFLSRYDDRLNTQIPN